MEVYVEYAFLENFCVDAALLFLALKISKISIKKLWLFLGATLGAAFAIAYPFLAIFLGNAFADILKIFFPALLCFVGFGGKIHKNERGRYALNVISFYLLSFAFAGGVYAVCGVFSIGYAYDGGMLTQAPLGLVFAGGVAFFALISRFSKRIYARQKQTGFLYPCEIVYGGRAVKTQGFVDSGNVARKNGVPVCFLSADVFFDLFKEEAFEAAYEELAITTVSGGKKIKLFFLDEIRIYSGGETNIIKKPYCSINYAIAKREYKVLLGAWALDGAGKKGEGEDGEV